MTNALSSLSQDEVTSIIDKSNKVNLGLALQRVDRLETNLSKEIENNRTVSSFETKVLSNKTTQQHNTAMAKSDTMIEKQDETLSAVKKLTETVEKQAKEKEDLQSQINELRSSQASNNMRGLRDNDVVPKEIDTAENASASDSSALSGGQVTATKFNKFNTDDAPTLMTDYSTAASTKSSTSFTLSSSESGKENSGNTNISSSSNIKGVSSASSTTPMKSKLVASSIGAETPSSIARSQRRGLAGRPPSSSKRSQAAMNNYLSSRKKRIAQQEEENKLQREGLPLPKVEKAVGK